MVSAIVLGLCLAANPSIEVRVDGAGFLRFAKEARVVYSTHAKLVVKDGKLVHESGAGLLPPVQVPSGTTEIEVDLEGNVSAVVASGKVKVGRLVLALFPPSNAMVQEDSFLTATERPTLGNPGDNANGVIRTGEIEGRNLGLAKTESKTNSLTTSETKQPIPKPESPKNPVDTEKPWTGEPMIVVRPLSEVTADKFTLADIAEVKAKPEIKDKLTSLVIGDTPCIGVSRGMDRSQILVKLNQAGIKPQGLKIEVPSGAQVRRASQVVDTSQWSAAAMDAVKKSLGVDVPMNADVPKAEFRAPLGDLKLVAESCVQSGNTFSVIVVAYVDDNRFNSRVIRVTPDLGSASVKVNQEITIIVKSGGATVEMMGKAKANGFLGQMISVVTSDGKQLSGKVTGPSRVEVTL